jgi:hypothetical protein
MLFRAMPMQHQRWPNLTLSGSASIVTASLPSEGSPSSTAALSAGARAPCRFSPSRGPSSMPVLSAERSQLCLSIHRRRLKLRAQPWREEEKPREREQESGKIRSLGSVDFLFPPFYVAAGSFPLEPKDSFLRSRCLSSAIGSNAIAVKVLNCRRGFK